MRSSRTPQRRKRVFVVADIGNGPRDAGSILFDRESAAWDPFESHEEAEVIADRAVASAEG